MRHITRLLCVAAFAVAAASCGNARDGRSPVFLGIDSLQGIAGGPSAGTATSTLISDIQRDVTSPAPCTTTSPCPTFFNDLGQATLRLALKDTTSPTGPTSNNDVTITRYHVAYRRADGRNTPGVDVPFGFDGATTVTVAGTSATTVGFELVRTVAKEESPLVQLLSNNSIITMLADVTFFGKDRAGNDISVTGTIQIDFGSFVG